MTGNSIAPITPAAGTIGTPVYVGSQPTKMAISDDGNIMYVLLGGANSFVRFNLMTQQSEFSVTPTFTNYGTPTNGFRDVAVQTGSENTLAVDFGYTSGMGLFDIDPVAKTGPNGGLARGSIRVPASTSTTRSRSILQHRHMAHSGSVPDYERRFHLLKLTRARLSCTSVPSSSSGKLDTPMQVELPTSPRRRPPNSATTLRCSSTEQMRQRLRTP